MPTPPSSHPVRIKVYGIDNAPENGVTVTLTVTAGSISGDTNSSGEVVLNVANAGSWSVGDTATIVATKTAAGTKTETLVLTSSPQTLSMTLAETSDLYYEESESDNYVLNFSLLTTFDGEKVTHSNPLPVSVVDNNGLNSNREYKVSRAYDSSNRLVYLGKAVPGTTKGEAKWQIIQHTFSGNKPADTLFAGGSDAFDKVWDNRTSYDYS
ncbi:hypothetical protein LCGC14_0948440 [marine sediment metagenome]|uniref:Uncharacterized protein n=1 Tax=marine sediment metagenome TaxID=412755 RepID=A0A0F9RPD7_9ZZZZ